MTPLSQYLRDLRSALATGDATEHTHRPALQQLLVALLPETQVINEPRRIACGAPDLLLLSGQSPLGYIECKDVDADLQAVERGEQMRRYLAGLENLVLTNYLEFRWYVRGQRRMTATLACLGADGTLRRQRGAQELLDELLRGFSQERASTVSSARDLAERMAAIARLVRVGIEAAFDSESDEQCSESPLHSQLASFRRVLLHDLTPTAFADMYAQTVCYGLFAARVNSDGSTDFTRQSAAYALPPTNPFMRWLFGHLVGYEMDERIAWAVDDLVALLARCDMSRVLADFGRRTRQEDPVVHFYETFLQAYDPTVREARGVYYTPEPVVSYIVRSVDQILKSSFGCADGLADASKTQVPNRDPSLTVRGSRRMRRTVESHRVLVLDPACGTGTFLCSVLDLVHRSLQDRGQGGMWPVYVREHLLPRLFGFELLMAPYAVAHLKLGMRLRDSGYDFVSSERLRVFLTNALEEPHEATGLPLFTQALANEVQQANAVKRDLPIMVVLGNPPYSGHSANNGPWMRDLLRGKDTIADQSVADYFSVDGKPLGERNPKWLNDDYVKFIRWGQWRINQSGQGVLAFISNNGYIDNPTFRGMRQSLMSSFDAIYLLDLHGSVKKRETAPDGSPDDNVFDIQQGVCIGLFVKTGQAHRGCAVYHADLRGAREQKYDWLWEHAVDDTEWELVLPQAPFYLFTPQDTRTLDEYQQGWSIKDAMPVNVLGFQTHRDHFAVAFDPETILRRISDLRDESLPAQDLLDRYRLKESSTWNLQQTRVRLRALSDWRQPAISCLYRPFDRRPCYFSADVMDRPRRELMQHVSGKQNTCLLSSRQQGSLGYRHCWVAAEPANDCLVSNRSREANQVFPLYLYPQEGALPGIEPETRQPNYAPAYLAAWERALGAPFCGGSRVQDQRPNPFSAPDLFHYTYALLHAPSYRARYAEYLKIDFPRIPLTSDRELFDGLATCGRRLVDLHLMRASELANLITRFPVAGENRVERVRFVPPDQDQPGRVYINQTQYFEGIPPDLWGFMVGGYQVLQKWLKDRRHRQLSFDDLLHYQKIVLALTRTQALMATIDDLIEDHGGWPLTLS